MQSLYGPSERQDPVYHSVEFEPKDGPQAGKLDDRIYLTRIGIPIPLDPREGLSRECAPPYPQRDRKRRLNGAVCRNRRIKRLVPCRC